MKTPQFLIDCHHHFWALGPELRYPWLGEQLVTDFFLGDYGSIRRPFLPPDLRRLIPEGYWLLGSVHCEAEADRSQAVDETRWIDALGNEQGLPTAHVGWAAFGTRECATQLDIQMQSPSFRGVRAKPATATSPGAMADMRGQANSLQDDTWCSGLALLSERGLSWDLRIPAWHLAEAAERLQEHPELRVILNHTGLPWDRTNRGLARWRRGLQQLADNPNVCVKLSELGAPGHQWVPADNLALLTEAIDIFGPERCLFASNAPVSGIQVGYGTWLQLVETAIAQTCPNARDRILWRNAIHWYRLDPHRLKTANHAPLQ
ncbi:amidohydrolase family protein [Zobellella taiwanensis]|uniref:Amidohydrolase n=1 Tax=Zobellella taiwanensis TaxID=347535 RepID=A0A2P7R1V2_9GAMM|nr:amidohydrolase family protein [Zobellella taiwanensis]PSJ44196.1 amidohydrolase [Zobellella taiwanensis]